MGVTEKEFLQAYDSNIFEKPSLSVDAVIFSIDTENQIGNYRKLDNQTLTVLLVRRKEHPCMRKWSLPDGFLNGAQAQEESLAMCSNLYLTQTKNQKYYEANRNCKSMLYTVRET